jgi:hypothetical protein
MYYDPIVDEIHKIREKNAEKFEFNIDEIYKYWLNKRKYKNRKYVNFEKKGLVKAESSNS